MQFAIITAALLAIAPLTLATPLPSTAEAAKDEHYVPNPHDVTFYDEPAPLHYPYHGNPLTLTIPYPENRIPPCVPFPALEGFPVGYARWGQNLDGCTIYQDTECSTKVWGNGDYIQQGHQGRYVQCGFHGY